MSIKDDQCKILEIRLRSITVAIHLNCAWGNDGAAAQFENYILAAFWRTDGEIVVYSNLTYESNDYQKATT